MSILSKIQLLGYRNSTRNSSKTINESLSEFKHDSKIGKTKIFLSHKHDELAELDSAISLLRLIRSNIYVDWLDEGMPKATSGETAKRIKEKIKENDKFILLATEAAIQSKWCNWELGYGDSLKYDRNIAIFPISNSNSSFTGSEYLQIYPRIEFVYANTVTRVMGGHFPQGYYVISPTNNNGRATYTELEEWLSRD
jgi:hypothetical protein